MKKHCLFFLLTFSFLFLNAQNELHGYWIDTLNIGAFRVRIILHFHEKDTITALDLYSIDQTKEAISFKDWHRKNDSIFAQDKKSKINLSLHYDAVENQISGIFKQGALESSLKFLPIDTIPKIFRPQTPQAPFPYKIEEVSIPNKAAKITLSGTLTIPEEGENFKAIVLLHGSGPHGRDQNIFEHKLLWILADSLTRQGYAVLRYDKRGVGKSKGSYAKATTADFCEDAHAAIEFLRQDKRIDKNNIGIIGHSEGGVIAPIVAAKDKKLAFIVSLAGSVQKGNDLMVSQWKLVHESDGYGKDTIEAGVRLYTFLYNEVNKLANDKEFGKKLKEALNQYELTLSEQEKELLSWSTINKTTVVMQMQSNPWLIHFIALSPEKYIAKVKCPVLAIFGEKDIQVPAQENADLMRKSLQKAKNEKNSRVEIIKGTNHLLQRCNLCTTYEYPWIEETVAPEVLELLFSWINAQ